MNIVASNYIQITRFSDARKYVSFQLTTFLISLITDTWELLITLLMSINDNIVAAMQKYFLTKYSTE